jgi:AcrR family transcriptional regulator
MHIRKAMPKLSSAERRAAIVHAVRCVFAEKGFDRTTTRELAEAAEVSEALLYKHFPTKQALYLAMQQSCCTEQDLGRYERIGALEPSASTLVLLVHFLISRILHSSSSGEDERAVQNRLVLRSHAEDGEFARLMLRQLATDWLPKVEDSLRAAIGSGDAVAGAVPARLGGWFTHHLAALIMFSALPPTPVVDYGVSRKKLIDYAVRFALRGMGLKDEAIQRYCKPKALAQGMR